MTETEPLFSEAEKRWVDSRIRAAIEATARDGLSLDDVLDDTADGPSPCPNCDADRKQPIGTDDPVCLNCDT